MTDFDNYILDVKGNIVKRDKDLAELTEAAIFKSNNFLSNNEFTEAVNCIMILEKDARNYADLMSYIKLLNQLLDIHVLTKSWDALIELVIQLSKKRAQFKQAIVELVQKCSGFVNQIEDKQKRLKFIKTVSQISENKIYVENERARLLMALAKELEADGNVAEALNFVKDMQVESYGSMLPDEKNAIMLEQIRLCLSQKVLVRAQLILKRIHPSTIDKDKNPELKYTYYKTAMQIEFSEQNYFEVAQLGLECVSLPIIYDSTDRFFPIFTLTLLCAFLCPYDSSKIDLLHRLKNHRSINDMSFLADLLRLFLQHEIIDWSKVVANHRDKLVHALTPANFPFVTLSSDSETLFNLLFFRIVEHNLVIIYSCYSQISIFRMSQLLHLSEEDVEQHLRSAVNNKILFAKIDRPRKVVVFQTQNSSTETLNAYRERINNLLLQIGQVSTLIYKEYNQAQF